MNRKHFLVNRREFLAAAAGTAMFSFAHADEGPKINTVGRTLSRTVPETVSRLAIKDPAQFRALQFTDVHFFCADDEPELDRRTVRDFARLVEMTSPDMIWVTGDFWHENPEGRGAEQMDFAVRQLEALGIPWLFTWGNHDTLDDYAAGHDRIAQAKHSLYRGGPGGGNYTVEITDASGRPIWELLCLNSGQHGIMEECRAWLRHFTATRKPAEVPAFCLVHIPVRQYDTLWKEGKAAGLRLEEVCSWEEDGSSLALIRQAAKVKAMFCGHDHVNDYSGVIDGVELIYGHATGHGGYGGDVVPKGAKLVTMNAETGTYSWETVLMDGRRWQPASDLRAEDLASSPFGDPAAGSTQG